MDKNTELVLKAQAGDKEASERLIEENSGLIRSVVKRFLNRGVDAEDLFQLGSIGMLKAVKRFDLSFKVKFSTYAVPMIIGEIKRYLRDDGIIKISRPIRELAIKIRHIQQDFIKAVGQEPSVNELAEKLQVSKEEIIIALDAGQEIESLNSIIFQGDSSEITLMEKIPQQATDNKWVENIDLKNALSKLNERERKIIYMRYFLDKTQSEVAREIGVSQVQISRIEKKVLLCMREMIS